MISESLKRSQELQGLSFLPGKLSNADILRVNRKETSKPFIDFKIETEVQNVNISGRSTPKEARGPKIVFLDE